MTLLGLCCSPPLRADIVADDTILLSQWMTAPFQQQDIRYTYVSSSGISNSLLHFVTNAQPEQDVHTMTLVKALSQSTFQLRYSVEIVGTSTCFYDGSLGVNVDGFLRGSTVTETIRSSDQPPFSFTTTLSVTNGGSAGPNRIESGLTKISVQDHIVVGNQGQINSFANTFTTYSLLLDPAPAPELDPDPVSEPTVLMMIGGIASSCAVIARFRVRPRKTGWRGIASFL